MYEIVDKYKKVSRYHDVGRNWQTKNLKGIQSIALRDIGDKADLAIIVGGDGTLIGVARNMVHSDTPLIGINQGRFGFLADLNPESMFSNIDTILAGEYIEDKRMLINTKILRDKKYLVQILKKRTRDQKEKNLPIYGNGYLIILISQWKLLKSIQINLGVGIEYL